jgi:hypothetical protein
MTTVTDDDREAAASYYYSAGGNSQIARLIREGHRDTWFRVQAFARHREAAEARARLEGMEIMREALDRLIAYYDPLGHLSGNGCHHGFKPASMCENEGCEDRELHRALQALETDNA